MLTIHIIFSENLSSNLRQPKQQQGIKTQFIIGVSNVLILYWYL